VRNWFQSLLSNYSNSTRTATQGDDRPVTSTGGHTLGKVVKEVNASKPEGEKLIGWKFGEDLPGKDKAMVGLTTTLNPKP
jgi:hypothetical protein